MHTKQLAKHLRDVFYSGNWTVSNLKDQLEDVSWKEATTQVYDLNTIAILTFHINYFVAAVIPVYEGGTLDAHDKFSFDCPAINSKEEWDKLKTEALQNAEKLSDLIEQQNDDILSQDFVLEKYGSYYRNILGLIEHTHYHLGQIAIVKKIIQQKK